MKSRCLIADDEPEARSRLENLLGRRDDVEIVGTCGDGDETAKAILKKKPDIVFLDVQMPEKNGFEVLSEVGKHHNPAVIFVTAYDRFAVNAFDVHAVDYLLKPFDADRLNAAVDRAQGRLDKDPHQLAGELQSLLAEMKSSGGGRGRIPVKVDGRIVLVEHDDIDWIEADNNYVKLHVGEEVYFLRETMAGLEARLPSEQFTRISRSVIVDLKKVKELEPLFHGEYAIILKNGTRLTLTRSYREKLELLMG